ncbi:rpsF [Wigglesworthia glossinidia endosymbiont of Glossina brevipalpis]|uniref:Small ribosomal subunit protein bS6 n=1 Tax=Wigglesworthia glossinidia brevipalpis TaxID=36870 RepID=RS6_WIGBR|nr:RecName: Full=Small ribosomal subunit protein bS6; AltName: Full=30S ribosomal protein S6 [Wigglesworthia glossinidia endosymbiont of Glossina brevipalpis]BAC24408.1 rpsF [Wigglesworthia glossinidia endosymbiont of Glossina brevipalpis]
MRHYEIVLMIHTDQSDQISNIIEHYTKMIKINKGSIHRLEDWGRRQLAYPIKKLNKAHYILMNIETSTKVLNNIIQDLNLNNFIIRNMIMRVKNAINEPSPMKKTKENKELNN